MNGQVAPVAPFVQQRGPLDTLLLSHRGDRVHRIRRVHVVADASCPLEIQSALWRGSLGARADFNVETMACVLGDAIPANFVVLMDSDGALIWAVRFEVTIPWEYRRRAHP